MSLAEELRDSLADETLTERQALLALPVGIHPDVPEAVYHARVPGVASKSALDLVLRSAARYKAWVDGYEKPTTPAMHLGRACHMARLEPDKFDRTYVIAPDFGDLRAVEGRTTKEQGKSNKDRRDAWRKQHAGSTILESKDGATTLAMVRSIAAHPEAGPLLEGGIPEVTLKWVCPVTGILCKARVDYWIPDLAIAVDLKSTTDAREWYFSKSIQDLGYHRQEAHYCDGFHVLGSPIDRFVFIAAEKDAACDLQIWQLDPDDVADGRAEVLDAKRRLAECIARDVWPGYPSGVRTISRPAYARKNRAA